MRRLLVAVLTALALSVSAGAALAEPLESDVRGDPPSGGGGDVRVAPCSAGPC